MRFLWKPDPLTTSQVSVTTTVTNPTLLSNPRPHPANRDPPHIDHPIPSHTENWLVAILRKHLQTAWDLVSQTRLWITNTFHVRGNTGNTFKSGNAQKEEDRCVMQDCDRENMMRFIRTAYGDLSELDYPLLPISGTSQGEMPGPATWLLMEEMGRRRNRRTERNGVLAIRNSAKIVTQSGGVISNSEKIRCT